ncbi:MAG: Gfo/Idh/MocA family oxidoreductase [Thermoguttaceae bacterium]|jgi:predicted dehydrogenase
MKRATRREFLKSSVTAAAALGLPSLALGGDPPSKGGGADAAVRIGIVGLGDVAAIGGVGGRGHQLIRAIREVPGARIVALCDVDRAHLDREAKPFKDRGAAVAVYGDIRKLLDDKTIDAVVVAAPNHWHALATVWACQAGKDVYVEKPLSHDIWEGRQMVAAARKYGRMVQVGTQSRSSPALQQAFQYLRSGQLGAIRWARAIVYRPRVGIGKVGVPTPLPATVDYDLWCGPSPKGPLMRKQLHYDWHWFWSTGNGEIGNNGIHVIDVCRWALGQNKPAPRAIAIGGRLGFDDGGETPNTLVAVWDYQPAPLICEVRNVRITKEPSSMGTYRGSGGGVIIECEGGYFAGDAAGGTVFDRQGRKIKEIPAEGRLPEFPDAAHLANFLSAVRSRRAGDLHAEVLEGHLSTACCHMANISYRLGKRSPPGAILETIRANSELSDAFQRCRDYLRANGINLAATQAVLGPWLTLDGEHERFVGEFAEEANALCRRACRAPFVVPNVSS